MASAHNAATGSSVSRDRPSGHATPPRTARSTPAPLSGSPRIRLLESEFARRGSPAVAEFWREVGNSGSPLVEDAGSPDEVIATFLWRCRGGTRGVLALVNKLTDRADLGSSLMRNVAGTDVWWLSYRLPADWRGSYHLVPDDDVDRVDGDHDGAAYLRSLARGRAVPDPRNPDRLPQPLGAPEKSVARMPAAPPQRFLVPRASTAKGTVELNWLTSEVLGNRRRVWTYTPHGYEPSVVYPLLVLLDGDIWCDTLPVVPTLDNMIEQRVVPPLVMVAIDSLDPVTRAREMSCHEPFAHFVTAELLPWVSSQWTVTGDPARTILAGQSLGGLAAAFLAYRAPQRFGNVLTQSGSFWWRGPDGDCDIEWLTSRYMCSRRLPLQFYVEVGCDEWVNLAPTRFLRSVLQAMGYRLDYREFSGGHDRACWRGGIADGLAALTRDW